MLRFTLNQVKPTLVLLFLVVGLAYQGGSIAPRVVADILAVYRAIGQPGVWRSANFTAGLHFANYVSFLIENIPQDATVILPPEGVGPWALSRTPYMQFFLAPRQVINCLSLEPQCAKDLAAAGAYVLVIAEDGYPGSEVIEHPDRLQMFSETWGVYPPNNAKGGQSLQHFNNLMEVAALTIWPALWLVFVVLAGLGLVHSLLPTWQLSSKLALGYGLSLGCVSLAICLASILGAAWNRQLLLAVTLSWGVLGGGAYFRSRRKPAAPLVKTASSAQRHFSLWHGILLITAAIAAILAVGHGYSVSDEVVLWGVKGYGIASRGLAEGASQWGTRTVSYPLNIPINIAVFKTLFAELLPASKVIFPLFFLSLLVLLYNHLSARMPANQAGLVTLLLATAPLIFQHAAIGYANLPLTYYLIAAAILLQHAFTDELTAAQNKTFFLAGCFLAFSAWTRPEGLILGWLLAGLATVWIIFITRRPKPAQATVALMAPLLLYTIFWAAAARAIYPPTERNSELISTAVQQFAMGNFHPSEMGYILRYFITQLFTPATWGVIGLGLLILPWLGNRTSAAQRGGVSFMFCAALLCLLLILGIYLLASYDPGPDISWWVSTGLNRMMLPGIALLWLGIASQNSR